MLLSLFCGPGGLDLGFENAGFNTGLAFDIRPTSVETWNSNRPETPNGHVYDIEKLTPEVLDQLYGEEFAPRGVIGGPPCQSFSVSNVHQNENDDRHNLPNAYANLLTLLNNRNPIDFFLFENVPGLLGPRHIARYNAFKMNFKNAGFVIHETKLNAMNYGVPQDRERIFIVGINEYIFPDMDWTSPPIFNTDAEAMTVKDAIGSLPEPVYFRRGLNANDIPFHPNHWCMNPVSSKFRTPGALREGQRYGRSFRTLYWNKPSYTVAYGHREVHVHPSGKRRLSVYEAMRLQSFPKEYVLSGTLSDQITQISEAVPPPLAENIANSITQTLGIGD